MNWDKVYDKIQASMVNVKVKDSVEMPFSREEYDLWWLLYQTSLVIMAGREKELQSYGISATHASILFAIKAMGGQATPPKISWWVFRKRNSTSDVLNRMVKKGLVKRIKDLDRKNLLRIVITDKGEQAYKDSARIFSLERVFSVFTEGERQQLRSYLFKLRDKGLEQLGTDGLPFPILNSAACSHKDFT